MISKIRAQLDLRNEQGYTGHVTDTHASRVREQEVVHQKVGHRNRHAPVAVRNRELRTEYDKKTHRTSRVRL